MNQKIARGYLKSQVENKLTMLWQCSNLMKIMQIFEVVHGINIEQQNA